jgi:L-lactate dehydrogenase complex protein LldE
MHVALFVSCLVDSLRPQVGFAAVRLLQQAGCTVDVPTTQTCCGQPGYNNGDLDAARAIARKTIKELSAYDHVVVLSGSCAGMIIHHYPRLFADDADWLKRANELSARSHELTVFLHDVIKAPIRAEFHGSLTYHDSCSSLRELGVRTQPRALLSQVRGLELREMEETEICCGFGGTFSVKYEEISARMAANKAARVAASGADALVAADLGCLLNITGRLRREGNTTRVYHIAEVLAGMADGPGLGEEG